MPYSVETDEYKHASQNGQSIYRVALDFVDIEGTIRTRRITAGYAYGSLKEAQADAIKLRENNPDLRIEGKFSVTL